MTFEELLNIYRKQNSIPPLYILCASYFGAIKKDKKDEELNFNDFESNELQKNLKKLKEIRDKKNG